MCVGVRLKGIKEVSIVFFVSIFGVLLFSGFVPADANVSVEIETTGDVISEHYINAGGNAYLYVNGVNWTQYNPNYIAEHEELWGANGISMGTLENIFKKLEKSVRGEDVELTPKEYNILLSILGITDAEIGNFYVNELAPIFESHHQQIQSNIYEIEAFYRTLEKVHPDIYCESRQEVMKEHGLPSVKCGLHSKQCYNGRFYLHEGGLDYCIHTDEGHSEDGMGIHIKDVKVYDSDENSLTPIEITLYNDGEKTLKPIIKVYVKKNDMLLGKFEQEVDEVVGTKTYVLAWDNAGLKAGDYDLKVIVDLDKKEIINYAKFKILPEGTLQKNGEITSLKIVGEPYVGHEVAIETKIKNLGEIPSAFKVKADIYKDGKFVKHLESEKVLIEPNETQTFSLSYEVDELGEYEVKVRSNHNMEDAVIFKAIPSTPTGRFLTSPEVGIGSILLIVLSLYGMRYAYHKKKGYIKQSKPEIIPKNYKKIVKNGKKNGKKGTFVLVC
ncbi:MAG TPA: hypothetical protein ENF95_00590 [Candidatus Aenigmarchaeota archaeon]|nr:hypothetical protein [Candidatus Aenigmarchaeota archaeon]